MPVFEEPSQEEEPAAEGGGALTTGEEWKAKGNASFVKGDWEDAAAAYTHALADDAFEHRWILYSNRSAARLKSGRGEEAVIDAKAATVANAQYWKGWSRLGAALQEQREWDLAEDAYKQGIMAVKADDPDRGKLMKSLKSLAKRRGKTGLPNPKSFAEGMKSSREKVAAANAASGQSFSSSSSSSSSSSASRPAAATNTASAYAAAPLAGGGVWTQVAFFVRVMIIANAVLYMLPLGMSARCWKYVLMGCILKYVLALSYHGRPSMTPEYGVKVIRDMSSHYLFLSFILFLSRPVFLAFFPLVVPDIYILAGELSGSSPGLAATFGKALKPAAKLVYGTDVYAELAPAILQFNAFAEIGLAFLFAFEIFTPFRNVMGCVMVWQYVRTRYMLGDDMKRAWARLYGALHQYLGGVPVVGAGLRGCARMGAWMTKLPTPGEAKKPGCTIM
jgi:hypothetical protein